LSRKANAKPEDFFDLRFVGALKKVVLWRNLE